MTSDADHSRALALAGEDDHDDQKLCTREAEAAEKECAFGVREIRISEAMPYGDSIAYLNLTTLEGERFCVEITAAGFKPVGRK